jgi:hypothetical protein
LCHMAKKICLKPAHSGIKIAKEIRIPEVW